jgi:hypothetical protein
MRGGNDWECTAGSTHRRLLRFREFEFREQNNAVLLAQSLLQIIASPVAMESVAIALTQPLVWAGAA